MGADLLALVKGKQRDADGFVLCQGHTDYLTGQNSNLLAQGEGRFVGDVFDLIHKSTLHSSVQLSSTRPSVDSVTTCQGRNLPLFFSAVTAACSIPPQQGTSMRTTVRLLIRFWRRISVSFSL